MTKKQEQEIEELKYDLYVAGRELVVTKAKLRARERLLREIELKYLDSRSKLLEGNAIREDLGYWADRKIREQRKEINRLTGRNK